MKRFLWAALGAITLAYGIAAVTQQLPRQINVLCGNRGWQDTFDKCKPSDKDEMLNVLPACPVDVSVVRSEQRPVRYVQLYWRLVDCAQIPDAWGLQTAAYQADNSPLGVAEFQDFVARHHGFLMTDARDTQLADRAPDGSQTATLQIDLVFFNRIDDDPTSCTIDYLLHRAPSGPWTVGETDSQGEC